MENYFILAALLAALVILLILIFVFLRKNSKRKKAWKVAGDEGEQQVAAKLKRIGLFRGYKVLNDIYLPMKEGLTQIDHIVIGHFGILVVESKLFSGEVYGNPSEERWLQSKNGKKRTFYNPIMQNQTHIRCIRALLAREGIYNIPIFDLVVFAGNKLDLMVPRDLPVIKLKKLKKELKKRDYKKDRGIDVKSLCEFFESQEVTDKKQIKEHLKYVKSKR